MEAGGDALGIVVSGEKSVDILGTIDSDEKLGPSAKRVSHRPQEIDGSVRNHIPDRRPRAKPKPRSVRQRPGKTDRPPEIRFDRHAAAVDRKSTRLNSSH